MELMVEKSSSVERLASVNMEYGKLKPQTSSSIHCLFAWIMPNNRTTLSLLHKHLSIECGMVHSVRQSTHHFKNVIEFSGISVGIEQGRHQEE